MIVHPAQPEPRIQLDIDACGVVLANLMSEHAAERAELLTAGVAHDAVNALYPLDFGEFVNAVFVELTEHGTGHLRADIVPRHQWYTYFDKVRQIRNSLDATTRATYEAEWFALTSSKGAVYGFMMRIYAALEGWHPDRERDDFAGYYARMLFALHWLARYPDAIAKVHTERLVLQEWVVNALLPQVTSQNHA